MLKSFKETFFGCECSYGAAEIVLFGAPFDSTASFRPGARFGSKIMRSESFGLETYSPYQDKDVLSRKVFDSGDLELNFGNPCRALEDIEVHTGTILGDGKLPVMIGGEHLVTLGAARAAAKKYPDLHMIHFDAHTDLRDEYLGEKLSHATVIRRCHDILGDGRIHQFGIRSGERDELEWAKSHTMLNKFDFMGLGCTVENLRGRPVYLTIDFDVLDPAAFPGTGTPEAGGVSFTELLDAIRKVCVLDIVGCDLVELAPVYDSSGVSTATALKILRELLLALR